MLEDIVILSYNENSELVLKDVIGMGETFESAIILNINTMNQKCVILKNPLIKDFIDLITKMDANKVKKNDYEEFITILEKMKESVD